MHIDITGKTDRFNLSVVGDDFINDCCFGEDFSSWLVDELGTHGIAADLICMEDFGWANQAVHEGVSYLVCIAGNSDEDPNRPNYGTWHVMVERNRSVTDKIFGKNKITTTDAVVQKITHILQSAEFNDVAIEP